MIKNRIVMRRLILSWVLFALGIPWQFSVAADKQRVSLEVMARSNRSKDAGGNEVETDKGLTVTEFWTETEIVSLQVVVRNNEQFSCRGWLEWGFLSDHSTGALINRIPEKSTRVIFSPGKKRLTLAAKSTATDVIRSEPFVYEKKTVERESFNSFRGGVSSNDYLTGNEYAGYIVLFVVDNKVVASASNSSRYLSPEWIALCRTPPPLPTKAVQKKSRPKK